jgi:hypothetical protein
MIERYRRFKQEQKRLNSRRPIAREKGLTLSPMGCIMGNDYSRVERPKLIDAGCISAMFGKPPDWFRRDRVRKPLYAQGFPRPIIRGRWPRTGVEAWFERQGPKTGGS